MVTNNMDIKKDFSCLSKNVLCLSKTINIDRSYQQTIEGYLDDIYKIVKCSCHSYVTSCDVTEDNASISGKTKICLTYSNEDNELMFAEFLEDFSEKVNLDAVSSSAFACAVACDKYCNFRVINQRRIDVHTTFQIALKVYDLQSTSVIDKCASSKLNTIEINEISVDNSVIGRIDFEEEASLSASNDGIKRVIGFDTQINLIDEKTVNDKIFIKASVSVTALYTNNKNEIEKITHSFEVSKIFEVVGINENSKCFIELFEGCFYLKAKSYSDNTNGKIEIYGDIYANITVLNEIKRQIITDGYIAGFKTENKYTNYNCCSEPSLFEKSVSEKFSIKASQPIKKITSLWVDIVQCCKKGDKILITMCASMIYESSQDELLYMSVTKELNYDFSKQSFVVIKACLNSYDFNITDETTIVINVDFKIEGCAVNEYTLTVLSDIECGESMKNSPAVTLYFAKAQEKLWDIAKKFSSDTQLIKSENDLQDDIIDANKVIIIPGI